jgi:hypothetical protein
MPDMNAEFHRICGATVEIAGSHIRLVDGRSAHRVHCERCASTFDVPGSLDDARAAIPLHFREVHGQVVELEPWTPCDA